MGVTMMWGEAWADESGEGTGMKAAGDEGVDDVHEDVVLPERPWS